MMKKYYEHKYFDKNIIKHSINNSIFIEDNSIIKRQEAFQIPIEYKLLKLRHEIYSIDTNIQLIYCYHNNKLFNVYIESNINNIDTIINKINNMIKI